MKEVLIITNYYHPEMGAASNRIRLLAEGLANNNFNVRVVAPLPNYPNGRIASGYRGKLIKKTIENGVIIHRLWLYASNSKNKLLRFFAMMSYSFSLFIYVLTHKIPKTVIIQSPPLIVAFFSVLFLRSKNRKLILNVSDLWPQAGLDLGAFKKNFTYRILEKIERFNYKNANLILGQSDEILSHVKEKVSNNKVFLYRNFPNQSSSNSNFTSDDTKLHIVYAGLLGVAQGIYKMLQELDYTRIHLHIYGAGAELESIKEFISRNKKLPITYHGSVSRGVLIKKIPSYHLAIVPLLNRIYGSVPSKIFELALLGIPIVYFGGGEGEYLMKRYNLGWIAKAGDYKSLNSCLESISSGDCGEIKRKEILQTASKNFDFAKQLEALSGFL